MFNVSRYLGAVVVTLAAVGGLSAQVEIDRILQRVGDQVITQLDVRRARLLKLVPAAATTDADIQRELENHWLMVAEVVRFNPAAPDEAALAGERDRWRAQFDTAQRFLQQARTALAAENMVFAYYLGQKAEALAAGL